jgi:hypothetical protein
MNPFRNQYIPGVRQWFQDASLFKFTKLTERVTLRIDIDFYNVFNNPNNPNLPPSPTPCFRRAIRTAGRASPSWARG